VAAVSVEGNGPSDTSLALDVGDSDASVIWQPRSASAMGPYIYNNLNKT
jgi:hypothetical protein